MSTKRAKTGECIYCGAISKITDDHIPPRNLFPTPRPNNLIAVPSCLSCDHGASLDDEYFRLMVRLRADVLDHPAAKQLLPTVFRSLTKPKKHRFAQSLYRSMKELEITTPAGIYLGKQPSYDVDFTRLDRVAKRIAKGLFFYEWKTRLPDSHDMIAYSESGLANIGAETKRKLQKILQPIFSTKKKTFGADIFSCRHVRDE